MAVQIRTKQQALAGIASYLSRVVQSHNFEELLAQAFPEVWLPTNAECDRISWAAEEIVRRLDKIGER